MLLPFTVLGQGIVIEDGVYDNVTKKITALFSTNFDTECSDIEFDVAIIIRTQNIDIFNRGNSNFPFERGIVFSTGITTSVVGPNNALDTSTGLAGFGSYFQIAEILDDRIGNIGQYPESTAIRFTVESSEDVFKLPYIFASEAYQNGSIECLNGENQFQDGFAIMIRGPGIIPDTYDHDDNIQTPEIEFYHGGKNIALLPDGTTEVGLHSVHNNVACSNVGFDAFYEEIPLGTGAISSNGRTTPFIAEAAIIPGEMYEVEIMLANRGNSQLDSVLFFEFPNNNPEVPNFEDEYILCLDENGETSAPQIIIDTEIDNAGYSFQWYHENNMMPNETGSTIMPKLPGEYTVEVIAPSGCSRSYTTYVVGSSAPFNLSYEISGTVFTDSQNVTILVDGLGDYEFQLDNSPPQTVPTFQNLSPGQYIARVTDLNGCRFLDLVIIIVDYPKFFTPNNDGYNDEWNINLSDLDRSGTINIFNRYGKLLKTIDSDDHGWDGTLNGESLPSDDYWFYITFSNNETFMGHFALKR